MFYNDFILLPAPFVEYFVILINNLIGASIPKHFFFLLNTLHPFVIHLYLICLFT